MSKLSSLQECGIFCDSECLNFHVTQKNVALSVIQKRLKFDMTENNWRFSGLREFQWFREFCDLKILEFWLLKWP